MSPTIDDAPPVELPDVRAGRLPDRYGYRMQDVFLERLRPLLVPGVRILDVGAGRSPTLAPSARPAGCEYLGLDISAEEIDAAPPGAYDRAFVHDIAQPLPAVRDLDVILSWQVLEHVSGLATALENLRGMLRPGGTLLAQTSGSFACFALGARLIPHAVRVRAMARFLGHHEEEKFPTSYDGTYASALRRRLGPWSHSELIPFYRGAPYLGFSRPVQRAYLGYENAIARRRVENLATHYLIVAEA